MNSRSSNATADPVNAKPSSPDETFAARVIANFGEATAVSALKTETAATPNAGEHEPAATLRAIPLKKLPLLVAGDIVTCQPQADSNSEVRVVALQKRQSELARPDRRGKLKPVAANLSCLLIVCAPQPEPDTLLMDQFCIVANHNGLEPVIVMNKSDMLAASGAEAQAEQCRAMLSAYKQAGFRTIEINTIDESAWQPMLDAMENRVAVLVGQSGVGKSSIVKRILPDQEIRVGALTKATGIGAHTTTVSCWYELDNSGALIDSPGVRQFAVDYLDPAAVATGFPEIVRLASECRFNNCRHGVEPGCAVLQALESQAWESAEPSISESRYRNYLKLSAAD